MPGVKMWDKKKTIPLCREESAVSPQQKNIMYVEKGGQVHGQNMKHQKGILCISDKLRFNQPLMARVWRKIVPAFVTSFVGIFCVTPLPNDVRATRGRGNRNFNGPPAISGNSCVTAVTLGGRIRLPSISTRTVPRMTGFDSS